jgi:hypothetical protein
MRGRIFGTKSPWGKKVTAILRDPVDLRLQSQQEGPAIPNEQVELCQSYGQAAVIARLEAFKQLQLFMTQRIGSVKSFWMGALEHVTR